MSCYLLSIYLILSLPPFLHSYELTAYALWLCFISFPGFPSAAIFNNNYHLLLSLHHAPFTQYSLHSDDWIGGWRSGRREGILLLQWIPVWFPGPSLNTPQSSITPALEDPSFGLCGHPPSHVHILPHSLCDTTLHFSCPDLCTTSTIHLFTVLHALLLFKQYFKWGYLNQRKCNTFAHMITIPGALHVLFIVTFSPIGVLCSAWTTFFEIYCNADLPVINSFSS